MGVGRRIERRCELRDMGGGARDQRFGMGE